MLKRLPKAVRTAILGISSPIIISAAFLPLPAWSQADAQQQADPIMELDIPAQSLTNALRALAAQTGLQMVFPTELTAGREAPTISGQQTPRQALDLMLRGSGLEYEFINERTVTVKRAPDSGGSARHGASLEQRAIAVEEVYVTARKREETIQEIPISISAFTAADLRASGIRGLGDLEGIVPGVNMGGGGNGVKKDSNPFIRGVGQRETKVTLDPAVGTYIDGIYIARAGGAMLDTVGVERVEILRGPQGTLFGKNTTGGAISVTTIKPENQFSGSVSVNVGNYGRSDAAFSLNVPLIDGKLLSRLTVSSKNSEGYFTNVVDNTKWGDDNRITAIGQLRWLPTDNLMFDLLAERTRIRETPRPQKCAKIREYDDTGSPNPTLPNGNPRPNYNPNYFAPTPVRGINNWRAQTGLPGFQDLCEQSAALPANKFSSDLSKDDPLMPEARYWVDTSTLALTGEWTIGDLGPISDAQLKSISSWRKSEQIADEDLDAVGAPYLVRIQPNFSKTETYSQEFQLNGSALNERLFFSTGIYYFKEKTPQDELILSAGYAIGPSVEISDADVELFEDFYGIDMESNILGITVSYEPAKEILRTENESYAWYGQSSFDITPQLQTTVGLRYTKEKRWSRYEKAYVTADSLVPGAVIVGIVGTGLSAIQHDFPPGSSHPSALDWRFGSPIYWTVPPQPIEGYFPGDELSTTDEAWTPMVSLKYSLSDNAAGRLNIDAAMVYATYSEGFHSGGVTAGAIEQDDIIDFIGEPGYGVADPITFDPEKVQNYEIGLKLQALNRRLQANIAVFYMDYIDMQLTSTGSRSGIPVPFVENAGKSTIQGFEGEFVFMPTANWRVMLNAAYTDAKIKEWDSAQYQLTLGSGQINENEEITYLDRSDEPMPRVPRWQAFLMTDYTFLLPNGGYLTPSVAARYTSEIYHGFDRGSFIYGEDIVTAEATTFVDARISYLSADEKLEISLWAKNLGDKQDYLVGGIPLADVTGATGQIFANPRTFGLEMIYNFGG